MVVVVLFKNIFRLPVFSLSIYPCIFILLVFLPIPMYLSLFMYLLFLSVCLFLCLSVYHWIFPSLCLSLYPLPILVFILSTCLSLHLCFNKKCLIVSFKEKNFLKNSDIISFIIHFLYLFKSFVLWLCIYLYNYLPNDLPI